MQRRSSSLFILFFSIIFLGLAWKLKLISPKPTISVSKQQSALNFNSDLINIFSLGQRRLISDVFWITTLLESDLSHYKNKDLNSWMFLRFKTISELDPFFLKNYEFGGQYLSIIKDDLKGAEHIFDKALSIYPDNQVLLISAAFLQAFELNQYEKAISLYQKLIDIKKAPPFVYSLIHKLKNKEGRNLEETFLALRETKKHLPKNSKMLIDKIDKDLYAIRAEIDLECLNQLRDGCNLNDLDGRAYIKKGDKYVAQKTFLKYRFYIRE